MNLLSKQRLTADRNCADLHSVETVYAEVSERLPDGDTLHHVVNESVHPVSPVNRPAQRLHVTASHHPFHTIHLLQSNHIINPAASLSQGHSPRLRHRRHFADDLVKQCKTENVTDDSQSFITGSSVASQFIPLSIDYSELNSSPFMTRDHENVQAYFFSPLIWEHRSQVKTTGRELNQFFYSKNHNTSRI